jgi:hypothetical protein
MSDRIKRGRISAVAERTWTEPIPDEFLAALDAAGLIVDDNDHNVIVYRAGHKYGSVWGPAVEGHWFAHRDGSDPTRVPDRDSGLRHVLGLDAEAVSTSG